MTRASHAQTLAWTMALATAFSLALVAARPAWAAKNGQPAPGFSVKDTRGKAWSLASLKGKNVVLEWHNQKCPFVRKHYESGNMQKLQKELTGKGFVWLTVISSAEGKEGYVDAKQADAYVKEKHAAPTAVILDPKGDLGRLYSAKTTPHMFVIDPKGVLVYQGAIDDDDSADPEAAAKAKNYVRTAASELLAGKPITQASVAPYGCSVKY